MLKLLIIYIPLFPTLDVLQERLRGNRKETQRYGSLRHWQHKPYMAI